MYTGHSGHSVHRNERITNNEVRSRTNQIQPPLSDTVRARRVRTVGSQMAKLFFPGCTLRTIEAELP